ncbi:RipA family octameric membrane protein [Rhodovulum strictum]|uniref:Uncharacterized protein n=1 Tax=Rhodovulum strictum TaxID=58314 RepID=A0A844BN87_9RHOB|nr:hypothetical protein [Rhodovulum strictum]MRH21427.1 hypothetical protein [Rhodovulum strictum]
MKNENYYRIMGINIDKAVDPDGPEGKKLREAYEKAHDIRKFEIQMYWQRSAYLWTVQALALTGLGFLLQISDGVGFNCDSIPYDNQTKCSTQRITTWLMIAIWCFGSFSAYVWLLLLRGAKFWQNNWERHVDYLEDGISGALYKTYPVEKFEEPYSVSKLNQAMAGFALLLWILIGFATGMELLSASWEVLIVAGLAFLALSAWFFDSKLRMSDFGDRMTKDPERKKKREYLIVQRPLPAITERLDAE